MSGSSSWSHKVYFKSQIEHDLVSARANALGKKVSTYLRDLAVVDLQINGYSTNIPWRPDVVRQESPPEAQSPEHLPKSPVFPDRLFEEGELEVKDEGTSLLEEIKKDLGDGGIEE